MKLKKVDHGNGHIFDALLQCYECEFSAITEKLPDVHGIFAPDTLLDQNHLGYLCYRGDVPVGFNVIAVKGGSRFEVAEFFILPVMRKRGLGYRLAAELFDTFRGDWEVKQIAGAQEATAFWRKTIDRYTGGNYTEEAYVDKYWGNVTRQRFYNG